MYKFIMSTLIGMSILVSSVAFRALADIETFPNYFKPISADYLYKLYESHPERKAELDHMFKVEKVYNEKKKTNKIVIAYTLFWKANFLNNVQPVVNEQTIHEPKDYVKKGGISFYDAYVAPLLIQLTKPKPEGWTVRLYLANDLKFLIPEFVKLDVEVFLMASNSINFAPGSMWRFLIFDDPTVAAAYVRDADEKDYKITEGVRNWIESPKTSGFFRLRYEKVFTDTIYSAITANGFGGKRVSWFNTGKAMKGFIIHRQLFPNEDRHVMDKSLPPTHPQGFGNRFPDYGFDERFLMHVLYFEAVARNQLTTIAPSDIWAKKETIHPWAQADYLFLGKQNIYFPGNKEYLI